MPNDRRRRIEITSAAPLSHAQMRALRQVAHAALRQEGAPPCRVGVALFAADELRRLNATHRNRDKVTNVLSFPGTGMPATPRARCIDLGDIAIAPTEAAHEAAAHDMDAAVRLAHLLVHGILHLLGYDHEHSAAAQRRMEAREHRILQAIPSTTYRDLGRICDRFTRHQR